MGIIPSSPFEVTPALPPLEETPKGERCALLIIGVCRSWTGPRFAKFLSRYSLKFKSVQKSRGEDYAILDFDSSDDRLTAYNFLHGCKLSDEGFDVRPYHEYDPPPMPYATQSEIMKFSKISTQTAFERMYPFSGVSEEDRLKKKLLDCKNFLAEVFPNEIKIVASPKEFPAHRRFDFVIGYNSDGTVKVGVNTSSRINSTVAEVDESFDVHKKAISLANDFQTYLRSSLFPPYDRESRTGKWCSFSVRVTVSGKIMATIATMGSLPDSEVEKLEETLSSKCDSLYWLKSDPGDFSVNSPHHAICGSQFVVEEMNNMKFTVYPFTVFPFNFEIYGKMMETIKEKAQLDENTVVVNLCCGTGLVSLLLAPFVKRTIGIDTNEKNISTSMKNAEENKIMNAYFVHGTESTLLDITNNVSSGERVVCIFDATNIGPHNQLAGQVNKCINRISQLVYITNAPETLGFEMERTLTDVKIMDAVLFDENPLNYDIQLIAFLEEKESA